MRIGAQRATWSWALAALLGGAVVLGGQTGCTLEAKQECAPGDLKACPCEDGGNDGIGYAACSADGKGYGACDCSGNRPWLPAGYTEPDASTEPDGSTSTLLADGAPCETDAQCSTGLCYPFNAKGPRCSRSCTPATAATDCPSPPYEGCNNRNVCKVP
jgi:hypothetical protein